MNLRITNPNPIDHIVHRLTSGSHDPKKKFRPVLSQVHVTVVENILEPIHVTVPWPWSVVRASNPEFSVAVPAQELTDKTHTCLDRTSVTDYR
jgi:hypothetical protein